MLTDNQLEAINQITTVDLSRFNGLSTEDITTLTTKSLPTLTTVQLSSLNPNTIGTLSAIGGVGSDYTLTSGAGGNVSWQNPMYTHSTVGATVAATLGQKGSLSLNGEDADISINGRSMSAWMARVEERLNILTPNPELEKEWDDLRKLGERYRRLEKKCKQKAEVWKKLKDMPPPRVD